MSANRFATLGVVPPHPPSDALPEGALTLCELSGELLHVRGKDDPALQRYLDADGVIYPLIVVPAAAADAEAPLSAVRTTERRGVFAWLTDPSSRKRERSSVLAGSSAAKRARDATKQDGAAAAAAVDEGGAGWLATVGASVARWWRESGASPLALHVPSDVPTRAVAWHPYHQRFAVALQSGAVHLFDMHGERWSPLCLRHEFQRDVQAMTWQPSSGHCLAVASANGICVWHLVAKRPTLMSLAARANATKGGSKLLAPASSGGASDAGSEGASRMARSGLRARTTRRTSGVGASAAMGSGASTSSGGGTRGGLAWETAWMTYLHMPGHAPVSSLSWSPDGRLLVSTSATSNTMMVWDVHTGKATPLRRAGGGITLALWAPDGGHLFTATTSNTFRLWETSTWTHANWRSTQGPVVSACWSPDGSTVVVAFAKSHQLHAFHVSPRHTMQFVATEDLSPYIANLDGTEVELCGEIRQIAWDPTGERLAVTFMGDHDGAQLVALLSTSFKPLFSTTPVGFVRGPRNAGKAMHIQFAPQFSRGALLTCCWSDGQVKFVPLFFSPLLRD